MQTNAQHTNPLTHKEDMISLIFQGVIGHISKRKNSRNEGKKKV